MTERQAFERFVADNVSDATGGMPLPDSYYDEMYLQASQSGQLPRWLAVIKEPPMRVSSSLAVGSPTARFVAIMVATLLLAIMVAGAGIAGSRLLAADGAIVVDQSGGGDFTTIAEAVDMAQDGDTILVRPGTYDEAVVITRDITLAGDGTREDIVISSNGDDPLLSITDSDADVSNLTLLGNRSEVSVNGGAPTLHDLAFRLVGEPCTDLVGCGFDPASEGVSLNLTDTSARIVGNTFVGKGKLSVLAGSIPYIDGNTLSGGMKIVLEEAGAEGIIRDNTIHGLDSFGINLASAGKYLIEGNTIIDAPTSGIWNQGINSDPLIRDNKISGSEIGIRMGFDTPTITGNQLVGNGTAIQADGSDALIDGNSIRDGKAGIVITGMGSPTVTGNDIEVTGRGIDLGPGSSAVVSGNTVCGAEASIYVDANADAAATNNETCE